MLKLKNFDLEICDRSGAKNLVADHLSMIETFVDDVSLIRDNFPDKHLYTLSTSFPSPWFVNIFNYLVASVFLR